MYVRICYLWSFKFHDHRRNNLLGADRKLTGVHVRAHLIGKGKCIMDCHPKILLPAVEPEPMAEEAEDAQEHASGCIFYIFWFADLCFGFLTLLYTLHLLFKLLSLPNRFSNNNHRKSL